MVRVVTIRQTCEASPSQWQGQTKSGEAIYARYRWGVLQIGLGVTVKSAAWNSSLKPLLSKKVGGPWDGSMPYQRLRRFGRGKIIWPARCEKEAL